MANLATLQSIVIPWAALDSQSQARSTVIKTSVVDSFRIVAWLKVRTRKWAKRLQQAEAFCQHYLTVGGVARQNVCDAIGDAVSAAGCGAKVVYIVYC